MFFVCYEYEDYISGKKNEVFKSHDIVRERLKDLESVELSVA